MRKDEDDDWPAVVPGLSSLNVDVLNLSENGKACQICGIAVIPYKGFGETPIERRYIQSPEHVCSPSRQCN